MVIDAGKAGRIPIAFIATLAAGGLGALLVLVIVVRGGPVPALVGLALAVLPVPVVLAGVLWLDRLEPEPPGLLAATFGAGAALAGLIGVAGHALGSTLIATPELGPQAGRLAATTVAAAAGGALVAESAKGAVLLGLLRYRRAELDGIGDGVVYGSVAGLGFALVSNLYAYVGAEHSGVDALMTQFARRGVLGPLWDPLFTSITGVGVAYAAMRRGRGGWWAVVTGWVGAVALHALWNSTTAAGTGRLAAVYLVLLAALAVLLVLVVADRRRIVGLITGYLPSYTADGVVTGHDVTMLASLRWRRQARQWARLHRGLTGARAMSDYQLAATELALACNRADRGLMPLTRFAERRADSLRLMRAALAVFTGGLPRLQQPPWAAVSRGVSAFASPQGPAPGEGARAGA
jgi:protease PrsW